MDGLINDLNDVSIGDESAPQFRDQRSRSSWAQVVSQEGEAPTRPPLAHTQNHWTRQDPRQRQNQCEEICRRPHKAVQEGCRKDEDGGQNDYDQTQQNQKENDNDGWETVGKKAPRKPHKVVKDQWHVYKQPSSEQQYSDQVEIGSDIEPSRKELGDLSEACNKLWELDFNRLVPGRDYQIDCGEGKKVYQRQDMAEGSLFEWLGEDVLNRPTIARFCSLLDNYNPNEGCREVVTSEERQEQAAFIEEISRTAPIQYLHKYLSAKGIVSQNYQEFKRMLNGLWFDLYGRGGTSGSSSAFEHVFVGEIKQRNEDSVSGFHNWLQFYLEEAKGRVDYQGYIFPRRRGEIPDSETQLLTVQFEWNGILKSVSSTMVGVSPEFEIALYTLCYYMGGEDNHVQVGPYLVNIKCYRHGQRIGSVFPIAES